MKIIAHISDLHFGRADPALVAALIRALEALSPDLLAVSGDLTQRAKPTEFSEARRFLDSIPVPKVVVPGNHDIALYDLYGRFIERLERFRRWISPDLEPFYCDGELAVAGLNTARSLTFKGGRINAAQVARLRERFGAAGSQAIRVIVAHHPIDLPSTDPGALVRRGRMALRALDGCGIDLIVSGHLHVTRFASPAEPLRIGGHSALLVQAGTAVSNRNRGEPNSFNVIHASRELITVEQRCWSILTGAFTQCTRTRFARIPAGWSRGQP